MRTATLLSPLLLAATSALSAAVPVMHVYATEGSKIAVELTECAAFGYGVNQGLEISGEGEEVPGEEVC